MRRGSLASWTLAWTCIAWTPAASADPPTAEELWILRENPARGFRGPFERLAVAEDGEAVRVATPPALYTVNGGRLAAGIQRRPTEASRLILAPGGRTLAWLSPHPTVRGRLRAHLTDVGGGKLTELVRDGKPEAFSVLHLGYQGRLRVTQTLVPGKDPYERGSSFVFWSSDGEASGIVDVARRPRVIVARDGSALLLLEETRAVAYRATGERLWERSGRFRGGVLSAGGTVGLLVPGDGNRVDTVQILRPEAEPRSIEFSHPVARLRISRAGRSAIVIGPEGRYFLVDVEAGTRSGEKALPFTETVRISDADFAGERTLVFGVLLSRKPYPDPDWSRATVIALTRAGEEAFRRELFVREAHADVPSVEVAESGRLFVAHTREEIICVQLGP